MMSEVAQERPPMVAALDRCFRPVETVAAVIAAAMTLSAMILVSADALLRYVFAAPLTWQYYLTENYLMIGMLTMPLAWGFRTGGYIRIEGLANWLPAASRLHLVRAGLVVSAVYVGALAWVAGKQFAQLYQSGEVEYGVIDWPVAWSWVWVPLGLGLLTIRLLLAAAGPAAKLEQRHDAEEEAI